MKTAWVIATLLGAGAAGLVGRAGATSGHAGQPPPAVTEKKEALENQVKIEVHDGYRWITSNGIPDHATGKFPGPGNPNSMSAQHYAFRIPEKPTAAEKPTTIGSTGGSGPMLVGVALNGVVFDPGTAEWWQHDRSSGWNYEALSGKIDLGADASHGHVQPNGAYHYHGVPTGLVEKLLAGKPKGASMVQIGWAADGFPIYAVWGYEKAGDTSSGVRELRSSYRVKEGERSAGGKSAPAGRYDGTFVQDFEYVPGLGDLDECNGRTGATPEFPGGTYYYVITNQYPFVPRLLHGTPDDSFKRHGPPGGGRGRRGPGRPGEPTGGPDGRGGGPPDGGRGSPPP